MPDPAAAGSRRFLISHHHTFYFPKDHKGFAAYCCESGDTHFINTPGRNLRQLFSRRQISFEELNVLTGADEEAVLDLVDNLIAVGILEESK